MASPRSATPASSSVSASRYCPFPGAVVLAATPRAAERGGGGGERRGRRLARLRLKGLLESATGNVSPYLRVRPRDRGEDRRELSPGEIGLDRVPGWCEVCDCAEEPLGRESTPSVHLWDQPNDLSCQTVIGLDFVLRPHHGANFRTCRPGQRRNPGAPGERCCRSIQAQPPLRGPPSRSGRQLRLRTESRRWPRRVRSPSSGRRHLRAPAPRSRRLSRVRTRGEWTIRGWQVVRGRPAPGRAFESGAASTGIGGPLGGRGRDWGAVAMDRRQMGLP